MKKRKEVGGVKQERPLRPHLFRRGSMKHGLDNLLLLLLLSLLLLDDVLAAVSSLVGLFLCEWGDVLRYWERMCERPW